MCDDRIADLLQGNDVEREINATSEDSWKLGRKTATDVERGEAEGWIEC